MGIRAVLPSPGSSRTIAACSVQCAASMAARLVLEDGSQYVGSLFGAAKSVPGEVGACYFPASGENFIYWLTVQYYGAVFLCRCRVGKKSLELLLKYVCYPQVKGGLGRRGRHVRAGQACHGDFSLLKYSVIE